MVNKVKKTPARDAEEFYRGLLTVITKAKIPFMVAGTYAYNEHTGFNRETKDVDIFCKPGDYPSILHVLQEADYKTQIRDERWMARALSGKRYMDIIFGHISGFPPIDDTWFKHAVDTTVLRVKVKIIAPEEMIWSKAYIQDRVRYDGADVYHLILRCGKTLDWRRLASHMDQHWEIFFAHLLNFRFIYPSEREIIPKWLIDDYAGRLQHQFTNPTPMARICRGTLLSRNDYLVDLKELGFTDIT